MLQFFMGSAGAASSAQDQYILTPAASAVTFHLFPVGASATYTMTPAASSGIDRLAAAASTYVMASADGAVQVVHAAAGPTYISTPDASSHVDHVAGAGVGDEAPAYIFAPDATAGVDRLVAAGSTYLFSADSAEQHIENGVVPVTYLFTPEATTTGDFLAAPQSTYIFTPGAAGAVPEPHRGAHVDYIFEAAAGAVVVELICTPLGRFRRGDVVAVAISLPRIPDAPPFATILDEEGEVVEAFQMGRAADSPARFAVDVFLGRGYLPGRHTVVFVVLAGGIQWMQVDQCFEVIGGGDAGGSVISLAFHQRGRSQAVLAHLSGGELVIGRNPSLDLTPPPSFPMG